MMTLAAKNILKNEKTFIVDTKAVFMLHNKIAKQSGTAFKYGLATKINFINVGSELLARELKINEAKRVLNLI